MEDEEKYQRELNIRKIVITSIIAIFFSESNLFLSESNLDINLFSNLAFNSSVFSLNLILS